MHEWFVDKKATRHGRHSYLFDPNIKKSMRRHSNASVGILFESIATQFAKAKYKYKYFGDKWAELGTPNQLEARIKDFYNCPEIRTIFAVRDIRTWICHNRISKIYSNTENIVPTAINYLYYFVSSFKLQNNICIKMEDMFTNSEKVLSRIDKFLRPVINNFRSYGNEWWNRVGSPKYGYNTFPKTTHKWWIHHSSARVKPQRAHIEVKLKSNAFWDAVLPVFDKYYNLTTEISVNEIDKDLQKILEFKNKYSVSIKDCYEKILYNDYKQSLKHG